MFSAGLATAFGTPVGAVLFALEEASSYWNPSLTWRCFLCTSSACLVFSILQPPYDTIATRGLLSFKSESLASLAKVDYATTAACFVIGVAGGIFGAFFNIVANQVAKVRATRKFYRLLEVMLLTIVSTTVPFCVSYFMSQSAKCVVPSSEADYNSLAVSQCSTGRINIVNSIMFDTRDIGLERLFTMSVNQLPAHTSAVISATFFIGMILTYGVALPTGLFMPSVLIGVTFGRVAAYFYFMLTGVDVTYLFAIAGAAAFLCGIQRNALSIVVIMMEATQTATFVLPIIVSSAVAKWIGDRFSHSLNHTSMHRRGVPFLEPTMCANAFDFAHMIVFFLVHKHTHSHDRWQNLESGHHAGQQCNEHQHPNNAHRHQPQRSHSNLERLYTQWFPCCSPHKRRRSLRRLDLAAAAARHPCHEAHRVPQRLRYTRLRHESVHRYERRAPLEGAEHRSARAARVHAAFRQPAN